MREKMGLPEQQRVPATAGSPDGTVLVDKVEPPEVKEPTPEEADEEEEKEAEKKEDARRIALED